MLRIVTKSHGNVLLHFSLPPGVSCGTLVDPTDGNVNVKGLEFGSTATYTCNSGFVLFGKGIRTCLESGVWNGQAPECRGEESPLIIIVLAYKF